MTDIYQFKITLKSSEPPIWRRVLVSADDNLVNLHYIIQACFDWEKYYLYMFKLADNFYNDDDPEFLEKKLSSLDLNQKSKLTYMYDFGDNWEHIIELEKVLTTEPNKQYPHCIGGQRAAPPEDSGGIYSYEDALSVLADKSHPNYEEMLEWYGETFDAEHFDAGEVNKQLKDWYETTV